jgi:hypothetical protein
MNLSRPASALGVRSKSPAPPASRARGFSDGDKSVASAAAAKQPLAGGHAGAVAAAGPLSMEAELKQLRNKLKSLIPIGGVRGVTDLKSAAKPGTLILTLQVDSYLADCYSLQKWYLQPVSGGNASLALGVPVVEGVVDAKFSHAAAGGSNFFPEIKLLVTAVEVRRLLSLKSDKDKELRFGRNQLLGLIQASLAGAIIRTPVSELLAKHHY